MVTNEDPDFSPQRRPATTPQGRENELIGQAVDLAEKQIQNGNVSPQVLVHYLRLGTAREKLEREKLREETNLLRIKRESIESSKRMEAVYEEALEAMRRYGGDS